MKAYIIEALMKRNVKITLGGYSLCYLIVNIIPGQNEEFDKFTLG